MYPCEFEASPVNQDSQGYTKKPYLKKQNSNFELLSRNSMHDFVIFSITEVKNNQQSCVPFKKFSATHRPLMCCTMPLTGAHSTHTASH